METESRKRRLDGSISPTPGYVLANNVIDLVFYEHSTEDNYVCSPEFTHQVFERERIDGLTQPQDAKISVNVCCSDLSTFVGFHPSITAEEQKTLLSSLEKTLPNDYQVTDSYSFESHAPITTAPATKLRRTQSDPLQQKLQGLQHSPPGHCVHTFTVNVHDKESNTSRLETYEVWLATHHDKGAAKLLSRAEKLAIWFIETADGIDFTDDRWEALFLYHVTQNNSNNNNSQSHHGKAHKQYYFVGYFTLFTFRNVLAGFKLRICQALILPHHQRRGLGEEMVMCTYRLAQEREEYREVTVEDPAPGFERLRDVCDCEWASRLYEQTVNHSRENTHNNSNNSNNSSSGGTALRSLSTISVDSNYSTTSDSMSVVELNDGRIFNSDINLCSESCKITPSQAAFVLDAVRYCYLPENRNHVILEQHQDYVAYRSDVKKRLLRENPELKTIEKEKKFKKLEEMFQELLERIKIVRKHFLKMKKAKGATYKSLS
jgi:hypothetical protein